MSEVIKDGSGKGYTAAVTSKNQLVTASVAVEEVTHISSTESGAYQFHFERTIAAGDTFEDIGFLTYTGEYKLQVDSLVMSREDVALASSGQAVVELMSEVEYTSGGAAIVPINLDLGSSNLPSVTAYSGTTTLVTDNTNEKEILDLVVSDYAKHEFKGALIINKGQKIALIGKSLNIGDKLHCVLFAYEVKEVI